MHQTDIMEELSRQYIKVIAYKNGYFCLEGKDYGSDLHVTRPKQRTKNNKTRYLKTGRQIDIQLKSTLEKHITYQNDFIAYNLEAKNYDDLVQRYGDYEAGEDDFPLLLIVFVFPNNANEWVEVSENELILRKCAYWYYPNKDITYTNNTHSQVIYIPKENLVTLDFFDNIFDKFKR